MTTLFSDLINAVLKSRGTTSFSYSESLLLVFDVISSRFISGNEAISFSFSLADATFRESRKILKVLGLIWRPSIAGTKYLLKSSLEMSRTSTLLRFPNFILFFQRFLSTS